MRRWWLAPWVLALALLAPRAEAISIFLQPLAQDAIVGDPVTLDVMVSGLGADSLSSYDLDVTFDPTHLAYDSLDFGTYLGGGTGDSVHFASESGGVIDFAEITLLSQSDLEALAQPDGFALAHLHFTVTAAGTSSVSVSDALAVDNQDPPQRLPIDSLGAARVSASAIPEPGAAALFALGAALLLRRDRRQLNGGV